EPAARKTADLCGGSARRLDLTSLSDIGAFAAFVETEFGAVDALVNSAAWFHDAKPAEDVTEEDWDRSFAVCERGPFF
ncbi:SDR family oxidoreductase, partial [Rhizobiaceae sp. 2RAB30]